MKVTSGYSAPVRVTVAGALPRTDLGVHPVAEDTLDGHDTSRPERVPAQAPAKGRNGSQLQTLRKRLTELAAVQRQTGKDLNDLTADEIGPLVEAAANKLRQMQQAQSLPRT